MEEMGLFSIKSENNNKLNKIQNNIKEELIADIKNDFIFGLAMSDINVCRAFLSIVLKENIIKIDEIETTLIDDDMSETHLPSEKNVIINEITKKFETIKMVNTQQTINNNNFNGKSIRLDIIAETDEKIFDIEMQCSLNDNYPKRVRYYLGMLDTKNHQKGEEKYNKLKETYIIFISKKDYFRQGRPIYNILPRDYLDTNLEMNDGSVKLFINLSAKRMDYETLKKQLHFPKIIKFDDDDLINNKTPMKQHDFSDVYTEDYFTVLYDLIEVFNGERQYSKSLDDNIKIILEKLNNIKNEKEVVNMETAMSQALKTIRNESWEEGVDFGRQEGRQEGIKIGEQRGIQIGEQRGILFGKIETIKNLLNLNITDIKYISNIVNLPEEKVKEIIDDNQFNI